MNAVLKTTDWYNQLLQAEAQNSASGFKQDPIVAEARQTARTAFERLGFPDRKQEAWRYSNIQNLLGHTFALAQPSDKALAQSYDEQQGEQLVQQHRIAELDSYRLVFMDNGFRPDLSSMSELPEGVDVQSLSQAMQTTPELVQQWLGRLLDSTQDSFIALNTALMRDGIFIHVRPEARLDKPLELFHLVSSRDEPVTNLPRVLVVLSAGAKATLIERFGGAGQSFYFQNLVEEIVLDDAASLTHYRVLTEQDQGYHLSNIAVRQDRNSHYRAMSMDLNGAWLRTNYQVAFEGQDAECELQGVYMVGNKQHTNVHTNILHHVPSCASRQQFKGLLLGNGRAVFDGRILVDKQAQMTDAHLSNGNLMLSDEAEVDTKPQLEIYADNVKCSHGTTVGQLEPEQLFYLRARGIAEADAYRMLCQGFASEVLDGCELDALRIFAETKIQQSLLIGDDH